MEHLLNGLRAAGERTRLRILFLLAAGELTVKDITSILGQSQPRISRHLKLMCDAGLLERHREGSWVFFRRTESGPQAALARMICDMMPSRDAVIARDLQRLETVHTARSEAARSYFEANAADWDEIRSLHVDEAEVEAALKDALGTGEIGTLFDLGTGTGRMLELFGGMIGAGIGIDESREMLKLARANLEQAGYRHCQVRQADIYNLPYANAAADAVIIHQVLHFLEEPAAAIREAARILAPEGRLVIADFARHELEFLRDQHAHRRLGIADEAMTSWTAAAGLKVVSQKRLTPKANSARDRLTVSIWRVEHAGDDTGAAVVGAGKVENAL